MDFSAAVDVEISPVQYGASSCWAAFKAYVSLTSAPQFVVFNAIAHYRVNIVKNELNVKVRL